nr:MAG TPA: coat protein [Caudoviricetes sp.]
MANTVIQKNGTHKRQERYADAIVKLMRQQFNIRAEFSRDYEGNPTAGAVEVPTRNGDITLSDYDVKNGVELTQSATDYLPILVDKHKACNELIDGYEAEAVPDNLKAQRMESAGYVIGKALELDAINALVTGGTKSTDVTAMTEADVYKKIATLVKNLKARGIPTDELRIAIDADTELLLLSDDKFANTSGSLGAELVRNGVIGKINGVQVKPNYLLPTNVECIVYAVPWCQAVDEWKVEPTINNLADGKHIGASALQGRMVYTDVVTNTLAVEIKTKGEVAEL